MARNMAVAVVDATETTLEQSLIFVNLKSEDLCYGGALLKCFHIII